MAAQRRAIDRFRSSYSAAAALVLNFLLLFVFANLAAAAATYAWHRWKHTERGPEVRRYGLERFSQAYPGWKREDLVAFLTESNLSNRWRYEPYTVFRPVVFSGRFVNVSANGYREGGKPVAWPPDPQSYNVFWFGGSTAFGVGVPDDQTIASCLQRSLGPTMCGRSVAVYNFGRPGYFSIQEGILFQRLLQDRARPDLAIFLDGLNDFGNRDPAMTPALSRMVEEVTSGGLLDRAVDLAAALPIAKLPLFRAARPPQQADGNPGLSSGMTARQAIDRWLGNSRLIDAVAREASSRVLFAWQPVPNYHYDLRFHLFADPTAFAGWNTAEGYSLVDGLRSTGSLGPNFLWLGDLQAGKRENLYVDRFHYSPKFSEQIATVIAGAVHQREPCAGARP